MFRKLLEIILARDMRMRVCLEEKMRACYALNSFEYVLYIQCNVCVCVCDHYDHDLEF